MLDSLSSLDSDRELSRKFWSSFCNENDDHNPVFDDDDEYLESVDVLIFVD